MTARTRAALAALFETGDVPDGTDYSDIFDSFLSLSDTTAQSVTSDLSLQDTTHTNVCAATGHVTGVLRLGGVPIAAHTTISVSASASASMFALITVSGVTYGIKLHNV
jgi:hypothetical protein